MLRFFGMIFASSFLNLGVGWIKEIGEKPPKPEEVLFSNVWETVIIQNGI